MRVETCHGTSLQGLWVIVEEIFLSEPYCPINWGGANPTPLCLPVRGLEYHWEGMPSLLALLAADTAFLGYTWKGD
ncbi:hypothetical protein SAMD00079811_38770 [Scytonema sp. HK-05]|nr:hypothetical protein SAMD00079811_38770 [Scytonema sp. HK-05]